MKNITKESKISAYWINFFQKKFKVNIKNPYNTDAYFEWSIHRVLCEFKKHDLDNKGKLIEDIGQCIYYIRDFHIDKKSLPTVIFIGSFDKFVIIPVSIFISYISKEYDWTIPASKAYTNIHLINDIKNDKNLINNEELVYRLYRINDESEKIEIIKQLILIKGFYDNKDINSPLFRPQNKEDLKILLEEDKKNKNNKNLQKRQEFWKLPEIEKGISEKGRKVSQQDHHTNLNLIEEMINMTSSFSGKIENETILFHNVEYLDNADRCDIVENNKIICLTDNCQKTNIGEYIWPNIKFEKDENKIMKYDKCFGNPPFQEIDDDGNSKGGQDEKLWIKFLKKSLDKLNDNGYLCFITPSGWRNRGSKLFKEIFQKYCICYIDIGGAEKYFPDVGSKFDWYIIKKSSPIKNTIVKWKNETRIINLSTIKGLPDNPEIFSIEEKFEKETKYLNCIRIVTHPIKDYSKKRIIPWIVSKEKKEGYEYPIKHTGASEIYWSNIKHEYQTHKKVILSYPGYLNPFYDGGKLGTTPHAFIIKVESKEEGNFVVRLLNCKLYRSFLESYKTNGFNDLKVICSLPYPNIKKDFTDEDLYKYFNLSIQEISFVESIKENKKEKIDIKKDYYYRVHDEKSIKEMGEVFTPIPLVKEIIDKSDKISKTKNDNIIDNSCGNGNFLIEILMKKIENGISHIDALKTIHGVDINEINIKECKERLSLGSEDEEIWKILENNIICADPLDQNHKGWENIGYMWEGKPIWKNFIEI